MEDKVNKIAYRVDEADAWFEEKGMMIENLGEIIYLGMNYFNVNCLFLCKPAQQGGETAL